MRRDDPTFDVWMVVADVFIGFLCIVFLLFIRLATPAEESLIPTPTPTSSPTPSPIETPGVQQPKAVKMFASDVLGISNDPGKFRVESEFSKVHLIYGEKLLFRPCDWALSEEGQQLLVEHFRILNRYSSLVARVQIEGHADSRPADSCASLHRAGLRKDNWMLSSLRALEVRDFIEASVKDGRITDGTFQLETAVGNAEPLDEKKIEACGRGDLHPLDPVDPTSEVNRRIEITVHFIESSSPTASPFPVGFP